MVYYVLAIIAGLSNPIQSAVNSTLNKNVGQPLASAFVIYFVAVLCCMGAALVYGVRPRDAMASLTHVPWWAFAGGFCNLLFVLAGAIATRKIGAGAFTVTVLTCAIILSILLDSLGALGLEVHAMTWQRAAGGALTIVGVVLVSLF